MQGTRFVGWLGLVPAVLGVGRAAWGGTAQEVVESQEARPAFRATIEAIVTEEMARHEIPGLAIGVRRGDRWVMQAGFGLARLEPPNPVTANTRFQIASLTKPVVASVVLRYVDQDELGLDDPARLWLSWLPDAYADVSVHDLLRHVSGVPRDLRTGNLDDFDASEFRRRLAEAEPAFSRGTNFQYANTGYILLGFVMEQVAERPFGEILKSSLVEPLGLTATTYLEAPSDDPAHAVGTQPDEGRLVRAPYYSGGFTGGGITTSLADLARWLEALDDVDFLSARAHEWMHSAGRLANGTEARFGFGDDPDAGYGMGWFLTRRGGHVLWTHGGAVSGFSSTLDRYPEDGLALIVLTNSKGPGSQEVARRVADLLLD